jgi:acid phosphatase
MATRCGLGRGRHRARRLALAVGVALSCAPWLAARGAVAAAPTDAPIDHVIVIYLENHTFDNLYGKFPGAEGIDSPHAAIPQTDPSGKVYATLPPVLFAYPWPPKPDPRFPKDLPNRPFPINDYVPLRDIVQMPLHLFYPNQLQIDGGKLDRFVADSDSGALTMGYFDTMKLPLAKVAQEYVLADHFFTSAFGGSWLNHMWLVCSCTPPFPNAPAKVIAKPVFDDAGRLVSVGAGGFVTPDGYAIDHVQPFYPPYQPGTPEDERLPPQSLPTIGDRLTAAGVSWAWYAEGWNETLAGKPPPSFTYHHQAFLYFANYAPGTPGRAQHLKDKTDLFAALRDGTLPSVAFYKPIDVYTENAGEGPMIESEKRVIELLDAIQNAKEWPRTAVIITYDDFGGWYDHVPPPVIDRFGPSNRVPAIILSPWAKHGFIDKTTYETVSILKFIEWRFGLEPLAERDAKANNLLPAFDFAQR